MLERLRHFEHIRHHKSGREYSTLQKLNLFYGAQSRMVKMLIAQLENVARDNPTVKVACYDALMALHSVDDSLRNEYHRDKAALRQHGE